jgi:bifunctional protein TilS/HprT
VERPFAHPAEAAYARLLDAHGIPWEYEPHTFLLEVDADGRVLEAVTPDFYLPTVDAYVECTTTMPRLVSRKRRKARKLRDTHGAIVTLLERADLERLLRRRRRWPLAAGVLAFLDQSPKTPD